MTLEGYTEFTPKNPSRAEYYRAWRKRNPEKSRQYSETYWAKRLGLQTHTAKTEQPNSENKEPDENEK